jgi:hypothetical protein
LPAIGGGDREPEVETSVAATSAESFVVIADWSLEFRATFGVAAMSELGFNEVDHSNIHVEQ